MLAYRVVIATLICSDGAVPKTPLSSYCAENIPLTKPPA